MEINSLKPSACSNQSLRWDGHESEVEEDAGASLSRSQHIRSDKRDHRYMYVCV